MVTVVVYLNKQRTWNSSQWFTSRSNKLGVPHVAVKRKWRNEALERINVLINSLF